MNTTTPGNDQTRRTVRTVIMRVTGQLRENEDETCDNSDDDDDDHAVEEEEEETRRRLAETQARQRRMRRRIVLMTVTARVRIGHGVRHL